MPLLSVAEDFSEPTTQDHLIGSFAYYNGTSKWVEVANNDNLVKCLLKSGANLKRVTFFPDESRELVEIQDEEGDGACTKGDQIFIQRKYLITEDIRVDESIDRVREFHKGQLIHFAGSILAGNKMHLFKKENEDTEDHNFSFFIEILPFRREREKKKRNM